MPLFGKNKGEKQQQKQRGEAVSTAAEAPPPPVNNTSNMSNQAASPSNGGPPPETQARPRPKLVFHCQQAHGSPTGMISGFTNVKELYQKIAECYDITPAQILFCTLNTHKVDMTRLLGGQIGLEDFIFAHIKGQAKLVDIDKSEDALGLTITDNGAGYAFIKRIKEGSIMDNMPGIAVGDHIEKINDKSLVGCRHFEVAKMLKEIPRGTTFTVRLVEPLKSGFSHIGGPGGSSGKKPGVGTGRETLRIRSGNSKGPATVGVADDVIDIAVDKINGLLESYMGINDTDLAQSIWEVGSSMDNPSNFAVAIDDSEDLAAFGFTDDFIFDLWGACSDAKQGRLKKTQEFSEKF